MTRISGSEADRSRSPNSETVSPATRDPLSAYDFRQLMLALRVTLDALVRAGDQRTLDLIGAVLEGRVAEQQE